MKTLISYSIYVLSPGKENSYVQRSGIRKQESFVFMSIFLLIFAHDVFSYMHFSTLLGKTEKMPGSLSLNLSLTLLWKRPSRGCISFAMQKFNLPQDLLKQFYSAIIESVLCSSITVWFGSATKSDIKGLQLTVRTAEKIIGAPLPNLLRALHFQSEKKGSNNRPGPLTSSTLPLWTVALWPVLQSTEYQNSQTQVFPPGHIPPEKHITHLRRITRPFDSDARLVFRSAHFATYCVILSVHFKPLCIGPIMSASADKGHRKREIEQSPMKKKFKDSTISREDLDDAIANSIKLALKQPCFFSHKWYNQLTFKTQITVIWLNLCIPFFQNNFNKRWGEKNKQTKITAVWTMNFR